MPRHSVSLSYATCTFAMHSNDSISLRNRRKSRWWWLIYFNFWSTQHKDTANRRLCTHMATPHWHVAPIDSHSHSVPIYGSPLHSHDNVLLGTNETSSWMTFYLTIITKVWSANIIHVTWQHCMRGELTPGFPIRALQWKNTPEC